MVGEIIYNSILTSLLNYLTSISLSEFDMGKTLINLFFLSFEKLVGQLFSLAVSVGWLVRF